MSETFRFCSSMVGLDVSTFNVENVTNFTNFMNGASMSTAAYDATLIAWAGQTVNPSLSCNFGSSKFTSGGAAEAARTTLSDPPNDWTIIDGGAAP